LGDAKQQAFERSKNLKKPLGDVRLLMDEDDDLDLDPKQQKLLRDALRARGFDVDVENVDRKDSKDSEDSKHEDLEEDTKPKTPYDYNPEEDTNFKPIYKNEKAEKLKKKEDLQGTLESEDECT
jgi:hypothetical protein